MRYLTAVGAVAVMVGSALASSSSAGADPTTTPETPSPSSASSAPSSATPDTPPATSSSPSPSASSTPSEAPSSTPAGAHQVTYTITTTSELTANIYYVKADPPSQGAANDPQYMPMARTTVGPGAPWTMQTTLDDPTRWAFISASGGLRVNPEFRCEISVDGEVVVSKQGGSGVQCALRPW